MRFLRLFFCSVNFAAEEHDHLDRIEREVIRLHFERLCQHAAGKDFYIRRFLVEEGNALLHFLDPDALADSKNDLFVHRDMIAKLMQEGKAEDMRAAAERCKGYVDRVCAAILGNTAVFKEDDTGKAGFAKFMKKLSLEEI